MYKLVRVRDAKIIRHIDLLKQDVHGWTWNREELDSDGLRRGRGGEAPRQSPFCSQFLLQPHCQPFLFAL